MEEKNQRIAGDIRFDMPASEKIENFWYHYKWHTIVTAFVVVVGVILILQLCTKVEYDLNILYAGEKNITTTSLSGDGNSEYLSILSALESVGNDENDDGNVSFNLQKLYILSEKELESALGGIKDPMQKASLESKMQENYDTLYNYIMFGDYYLYFLSEDIFHDYEERFESSIFASISEYTKAGGEYSYAGDGGIYLSSLGIYEATDLSLLPPDTVVCIRLPGVLGARDDGKSYAAAEDLLKKILAFDE